jgi:hypothetical protein
MQKLTDIGDNLVKDIASRYGLSDDAVVHMLIAVNNGGGSMAQFSCPELGGSGQWMRGGMTMVGDMFNNGLKNTVDNLCNELANVLNNNQMFQVIPAGTPGSAQWWPTDLGSPFSSGAQNNIRYAVFPNRLAVEINGQISVYDTLDHNIGGVSQQQGSNDSLTFTSQWGSIAVASLPIISGKALIAPEPPQNTNFMEPEQNNPIVDSPSPTIESAQTMSQAQYSVTETLQIIEKLANLRDLGALSDDEFNNKKSELLKKI